MVYQLQVHIPYIKYIKGSDSHMDQIYRFDHDLEKSCGYNDKFGKKNFAFFYGCDVVEITSTIVFVEIIFTRKRVALNW